MMKERKSEMGESLEHMNMLGHSKEHHACSSAYVINRVNESQPGKTCIFRLTRELINRDWENEHKIRLLIDIDHTKPIGS